VSWSEEVFRLYERDPELGALDYPGVVASLLPEDRPMLEAQVQGVIATGEAAAGMHRVLLPSGRVAHHANTVYGLRDEHGRVIRLSGTVQDITERVLLEKQVQSQERLAAVGQLAAGIAHDFNNILSSITLYSDLLRRTLPDLSPANAKRLHTISQQSHRASQLIQQILDFSRQSPLQRTRLNLVHSLTDLVELLRRTLPENIKIHLLHDSASYVAEIDPTRFQQIFMNLAFNSRDALEGQGGNIIFRLAPLTLHPHESPPVADMGAGEWLKIEVADDGHGMAPEVLSHIFEPFFTTKPTGKGTGLGLPQVYGVVSQFGGFLTVSSEPGKGTTFTIYLPRLFTLPTDPTAEGEDMWGDEPAQGTKILLVEDDSPTREALLTALEALGYELVVANHGREALHLLQQPQEPPIALVVSDRLMPEMSGLELVATMRQQGITTPVVMLSGYLLEDDIEEMEKWQVTGWLHKPPNINQLAALIRQGLG
jgi:two-component system, cell cycle sensor histidine kinase and response regulator CckA